MWFTIVSLTAFFLTFALTYVIRRFALKEGIVDDPKKQARKIHEGPIPLLGGVAIYIAFLLTISLAIGTGLLPAGAIALKHIIGLLAGGAWLVIGGVLDDKYNLSPRRQIIWPVLAVITVITAGIGIESITHPLGGQWFLDQVDMPLFSIGGIPYKVTLLADLFTFVWLMGMIYATKFFDGLDGLVSGITIIGALVVYFTSLLAKINQPETALVAIIVAGAFAGFLVWNFHPAKIFLGESGSTLAGFLIGSLAIIAESKVITTFVVLALPILDLIWVISRRILKERTSPVKSDRKHIHHRLLDAGFTHRGAAIILYIWTAILGVSAWVYQISQQWMVLAVMLLAMMLFAGYLVYKARKHV